MELKQFINAIVIASHALDERKEEVNKLNVFPVPDGDTGTNMALTIKSVEQNVSELPVSADKEALCKAITTGALMGARGNSGVITSQILRGICEGIKATEDFSSESIATIFDSAEEVAFSAVRKPVKGTILTVLSDIAQSARVAARNNLSTTETLNLLVSAAYDSVKATPEFLPVLKENNVVDAGGYGLAILVDGFVSAVLGKEGELNLQFDASQLSAPKVEIEQINDWEGSKYRYCNEFLVDSDKLVIDDALSFLATMGDCELCVGATPKFKVHVHSNTPDKVLKYFLDLGQISEVHIHNMDLQSVDRAKKIASEKEETKKKCAIVAVCVGEGTAEILKSLNVDVIVSGGQTMNPSTKDLLDAAQSVLAESYLFLPNNSNIVMSANAACELLDVPAKVVPTKSAVSAFSALFAYDEDASLDENVEEMTEALEGVLTGEVTRAVKDSKDKFGNKIKSGDVIGILQGEIVAVGDDVSKVVIDLIEKADGQEFDTCTILSGEDFKESDLEALVDKVSEKFDSLEVESHEGGQPLYPVVFSLE